MHAAPPLIREQRPCLENNHNPAQHGNVYYLCLLLTLLQLLGALSILVFDSRLPDESDSDICHACRHQKV